jgi:hypothetical protein
LLYFTFAILGSSWTSNLSVTEGLK